MRYFFVLLLDPTEWIVKIPNGVSVRFDLLLSITVPEILVPVFGPICDNKVFKPRFTQSLEVVKSATGPDGRDRAVDLAVLKPGPTS